TVDNVEQLSILLYDGTRVTVGRNSINADTGDTSRSGQVYSRLIALRGRYGDRIRERFPRIPRRVSGYNLDELLPENGFHLARALVGSEGTCVVILEAIVRLIPSPLARS